jgi:hypothetical protein
VWASRRTSILEPADWKLIIDDDGYRLLENDEPVFPGDIVAYVDEEKEGEILHVGRVYYLAEGLTPQSKRLPWVISKWNSTSGESLHSMYDVPYTASFRVGYKLYTDRPAGTGVLVS